MNKKSMKTTRATLKSFVNKNKNNLFIRVDSKFDGMTDAVEMQENRNFRPVTQDSDLSEHQQKYTLGINGLWLVGSSRDYFEQYQDEQFTGIECSNACGNWVVAVKK